MSKTMWSAAICFADLARLSETVDTLAESGCAEVHVDITDGDFAPGFTLGYDFIRALKGCTSLPIHAHLMVQNPERHIKDCADAGCSRITIHAEATPHAHRALQQIHSLGIEVGIALKPGSPLTKLEYLIPHADYVHLILEDRGAERSIPMPVIFERIKILRSSLDYQESPAKLVAEGYMNAKNAASAIVHGADMIVWDNAAVFAEGDLVENITDFLAQVDVEQNIT